MIMRRLLAASLVAATVLGAASATPAGARDLAIATLDDPALDALDSVLVRAFAGFASTQVHAVRWPGGQAALRAHLGAGAAEPWDVVMLGAADLATACDQGLLEKLDWARIGGRDRFLPMGTTECGVGAAAHSTVLAWDRDKLVGTPLWADFWDVVKNPGKRGLQRVVRGNLEVALLADGVAPGDVYGLLRTQGGVDRAFRKLDQLKPYIDWWQADADATRILGSGEVLMTSAPNLRIAAAGRDAHRHFGIQWTGSLLAIEFWAIAKGSANADPAYQFVGYAEDPHQQAALAGVGYGWLAKGAMDGQPPAALAVSPTAADHLAGALVIDDAFWRDNLDKLTGRFNAWLAAH
jgi:putative spermidine/putrescine transport system substrate-binding protein